MHAALRPYVTASVALVGASVIAVTPVAPTPLEMHIASPAVELTAAPKPLEFYGQVTLEALTNAAKVVGPYLRIPFSLIDILTEPVYFLHVVVSNLFNPVLIFNGAQTLISPVLNGIGATAVALKDVAGAISNHDPVDLAKAIVDIPARIADGVLNGGYPLFGVQGPQGFLVNGLLSPLVGPLAYPQYFLLYSFTNGPYSPTNKTRFGVDRNVDPVDSSSTPAPVNEAPSPGTATVTLEATTVVAPDPTPADKDLAQAEGGASPEAVQAVEKADAATTPTDTEAGTPDRGLRANREGHPVLDNIRKRIAERRAHADGPSSATKHVRAARSDSSRSTGATGTD